MADTNNELPEGTDKVIVGASATTTTPSATASGSGSEGELLVAKDTTPTTTGTGTGSGRVIDKLRTGSGKLSGQAADKARGLLGQGIERSAEAIANVGKLVGDTAEGIDERLGAEYGDYARRAATAIEDAANSIAAKDPDELIDDTRNFVRKSPAVALAGAAVAGFVIARLVKSGLAAASGDDDGEDGAKRGSSKA